MGEKEQIPVLVTTAHRGVFFGYANPDDVEKKDTLKLNRARNCIAWRGLKGFLDLAVSGPNDQCRIGAAADLTLHDITSVASCSPEAVKAWESAPWA